MADNVAITAGSGTNIATDDIAGVHYQRVKLVDGTLDGTGAIGGDATNGLDVDVTRLPALVAGTANIGDVDVLTIAAGDNNIGNVDIVTVPADPFGVNADAASATGSISAKLRFIAATGIPITSAIPAGSNLIGAVNPQGYFTTVSTTVTRPAADTTQYAVNDALSDSTSAPTTGGFTFTNAARASGGSGIITDAVITTDNDAATQLQGEIMIFNQAVTAINDNAAFAVTDAEARTLIGKIPFTLEDIGNNGWCHVQNLNIGFTCVGTANLRFLVRVKNTYTPAGSEAIVFILKCLQVT
jgi:hypothetical protein